ncbi:hypothetical protein D3C84_1231750 [compost metagenome]
MPRLEELGLEILQWAALNHILHGEVGFPFFLGLAKETIIGGVFAHLGAVDVFASQVFGHEGQARNSQRLHI